MISLHRSRHYRWRTAKFHLCSALMSIEQWGFFSVPHLHQHWTSVYTGLLRGPVTITSFVERLAIELSLPVLRFRSVVAGIRTANLLYVDNEWTTSYSEKYNWQFTNIWISLPDVFWIINIPYMENNLQHLAYSVNYISGWGKNHSMRSEW